MLIIAIIAVPALYLTGRGMRGSAYGLVAFAKDLVIGALVFLAGAVVVWVVGALQ